MNYLSAGSFLNRNCYKITRFMAQGGFGITYLAEEIGYFKRSGYQDDYYVKHPQPEKVVVKELYYSDYCQRNEVTGLVSISNTEKKVEFEKLVNKQLEEGKILRMLEHPNIVRTRDIFEENGTAYMVMDFEESTDLEEQVKKLGRLEKGKALKYINQILQAVQYIHNKKILHLDITPSNILVRKGTDEAVLIDFGASLTYDTQNKAKSNTSKLITGMKRHFAPVEQADIDNLKHFDATFDTYAIGASLYYILTGQLPPLSSMVSTGKERITPPSESVKDPGLNEYLDAVIIKAMAPKFHDRFSSATGFHQMLQDETAYTEKVNSIKKTITSGKFKEALEEINAVSNNFLFTETLKRLKIQCEQELERKINEEQYQRFLNKGQEWFNKQEYRLAINEFEKAGMTLPGKTEHNEKIKFCKNEIEKQLAQQQLKGKIDDLLFDARQSMADKKYSEARQRAETILKSSPDNKDALQILEQIKNLEQNEIIRLKAQAEKLYAEEQYPEALKIYRLLQPKDVMDAKTAQILVKLRDTDKLIELSNILSGLSSELNKINKEADDATERISDLRKRYTEAEAQRHNLKLMPGSLRKLSDELNVGLSAALKMANDALERKTN